MAFRIGLIIFCISLWLYKINYIPHHTEHLIYKNVPPTGYISAKEAADAELKSSVNEAACIIDARFIADPKTSKDMRELFRKHLATCGNNPQ